MKQQLFAVLTILASASLSLAAPIAVGDVTYKDDLVILNKKVICSAFSGPLDPTAPHNIIYGTYVAALAQPDGSILVDGKLDDEAFEISGRPDVYLNISLQKNSGGNYPVYSFTTDVALTNQVIDGRTFKGASLIVSLDGRTKTIGCSLK